MLPTLEPKALENTLRSGHHFLHMLEIFRAGASISKNSFLPGRLT